MWQEEVIQQYFHAWVSKDVTVLRQLLSPDVVYMEAHGPCYVGIGQVIKWFGEYNKLGTVMEWTAKRFFQQEEETFVEWAFRGDYQKEEMSMEGISVFTFDDLHKILSVREFQAVTEHVYPYGLTPIVEKESEGLTTSETEISEVKVLQYDGVNNARGTSHPLYHQQDLEAYGIRMSAFEQRMFHAKRANTLYGIRFQNEPRAQNKLVYCFRGRGIDYAVDLRRSSPTFLKWTCVELSAENNRQVYIPKGFGHAFLALEDNTCMVCCFDEPYDERYSRTLAWNDEAVGILYPVSNPELTEQDANAPTLENCDIRL